MTRGPAARAGETLGLGAPFHTGVIVPDLNVGMGQLSAALGLRWGPIRTMSNHQWTKRHGFGTRTRSFAFSVDPPLIEILQVAPRTIWGTPGIHHFAFWVSDIEREAARIEGLGFVRELTSFRLTEGDEARHDPDRTEVIATYHRQPDSGLFVEMVAESLRPLMLEITRGHEL
jgi:Glyoxalase/Bleomycin resistance protein/Dioxygenase superfamily